MKRILITGAAGFIGFHLALKLHARGDHVIGYDNFNTYYSIDLKKNRAQVLAKQGIKIYEGDICNSDLLKQLIETHRITHIIHLAAQAGVRYSITNPYEYLKANIDGFLNVLEICRQQTHIKLTYASSSSVYGLNDKTPFSIEDPTDKQASLYGVTKKADELMAQTYHHLYDISATGLRFFTVYGPWGRPDMAYFSFTQSILAEEPINIYNYGKMKRDFTYVDDIVDGTMAAIDLESKCELFNLGNNQPVELSHLITLLEEGLGKKAIKNFLPMQKGDVISTYADIEKSRTMLGFQPKTSLETGISHFVTWYKQYFNIRSISS